MTRKPIEPNYKNSELEKENPVYFICSGIRLV